jgi:hypothetical protein
MRQKTQNHIDVTWAPGAAMPCFDFEQKIAKSRWTFAIKGKSSAAWKFGARVDQSLRYLCDLL